MKIPSINELKKKDWSRLKSEHDAYHAVKRVLDIIIALKLLIGLAPLWLLIMILIALESKGNPIFSHIRIGKDGRQFRLYKFRTMKASAKEQEYAPTSLKDPRITKMGKFLRRTSLDEIPQLFNVILGEMAIIGPRPEMKFIADRYSKKEKIRLLVRPGMTGLWQVCARKDEPLHKNVEYDLYYIAKESVMLDLKILINTFIVIVNGKGAY
jgi:lipopolysaccharide/colanic/teichoic acid biosynthesis glycosyltransferase